MNYNNQSVALIIRTLLTGLLISPFRLFEEVSSKIIYVGYFSLRKLLLTCIGLNGVLILLNIFTNLDRLKMAFLYDRLPIASQLLSLGILGGLLYLHQTRGTYIDDTYLNITDEEVEEKLALINEEEKTVDNAEEVTESVNPNETPEVKEETASLASLLNTDLDGEEVVADATVENHETPTITKPTVRESILMAGSSTPAFEDTSVIDNEEDEEEFTGITVIETPTISPVNTIEEPNEVTSTSTVATASEDNYEPDVYPNELNIW